MLSSLGFVSYINSYTWVTVETKSCIDHIFIKINMSNKNVSFKSLVIDTDLTDHFPFFLKITTNERNLNHNTLNQHTTQYTNIDKFTKLLENVNWNNVISLSNPILAYQKFIEIIYSLKEQCNITNRHNTYKKKIKPWISQSIIMSIKHRDKMKK